MSVRTVIVADADPSTRAWMALAMRGLGAAVLEAATGADVLDYLANFEVDVIVAGGRLAWPNVMDVVRAARHAGITTPIAVLVDRAQPFERRPPGVRFLHGYLEASDLRAAVRELVEPPDDYSGASA